MTERRPGQWPIEHPVDLTQLAPEPPRATRDHARFELVVDNIRIALAEQPSETCVRRAARRWQDAITAAADDVITQMRKAG